MSYTVGDGIVVVGLAVALIGYLHITHRSKQARLEAIHQERLVAMERGIPLPELPMDPDKAPKEADTVVPILGVVLLTLSLGTMVAFLIGLSPANRHFWVAPLPTAFLGAGLVAFHFLQGKQRL